MNKYPCINCGKMNEVTNYCDWNCQIENAKKDGGKEILPNGLPIRCIMADGTMLECEHGDHPTYKFPVTVEFHGTIPEDLDPYEKAFSYGPEIHALIYEDGYIAVTLHEYCYFTWYLIDGSFHGGREWLKDWRLSKESIDKIKGIN